MVTVLVFQYWMQVFKNTSLRRKAAKREREKRKVRTQLDNASGNMSHLTFSGLLHALYDKKWRDSGADTHHQSSPTTLPFSPLCTLTTAPNVLQTYPPPGHLSECLKNYRVICLSFLQNVLNTKITYSPFYNICKELYRTQTYQFNQFRKKYILALLCFSHNKANTPVRCISTLTSAYARMYGFGQNIIRESWILSNKMCHFNRYHLKLLHVL